MRGRADSRTSVVALLITTALGLTACAGNPASKPVPPTSTTLAPSTSTTAVALPRGPVYPAPISAGEGSLRSGCPSLSGVNDSAQPSMDELAQALYDLGGSKTEALRATDPAFWPMILTNKYGTYYGQGSQPVTQLVSRLLVTRASQSGYEDLISHCGSATVASSWIVQVCVVSHGQTAAQGCAANPALAGKYALIDRLTHWLIVYEYP